MKQKFTPNDLIKYIYNETNVAESLAIEKALSENWSMYEAYEEMHNAYLELPKAKFNPSPNAIQQILRYSEETAVETSH